MVDRIPGETRKKIYTFVRDRILAGNPPTIREVQSAFKFRAVQTAREHLERLVSEGLLAKDAGRSRGYRLAAERSGPPTRLVPLVGRVQAGSLTTAVEVPDGYVAVQAQDPGAELFALRVRGDSMRDAAILEGDIVIVRRQPRATSGDIVVALVEDEATVKRFWHQGNRMELRPENQDYPVIVPPPRALVILGKVIEVRRYLEATIFDFEL